MNMKDKKMKIKEQKNGHTNLFYFNLLLRPYGGGRGLPFFCRSTEGDVVPHSIEPPSTVVHHKQASLVVVFRMDCTNQ